MNNEEQKILIDKLSESHSILNNSLEGIDLEILAYTDSDWRIRDILGHIATWDREVTKSLRAFLAETEYYIPVLDEDETDFNQQAIIEQRELSTQQIIAEWEQAREDFKAAISEIPTNRFPGDLLYPWGNERGSIAQLAEYMIEHDEEHRVEIERALEASQVD